ncbi:hypothetical protein ACFXJ8_26350 [Nonomuraea sp. NPDC059194]
MNNPPVVEVTSSDFPEGCHRLVIMTNDGRQIIFTHTQAEE